MRWFVFARREYDQPVARRAAIDAGDAEVFAFKLYDQWRWTELFVVRQADVVEVVRTP